MNRCIFEDMKAFILLLLFIFFLRFVWRIVLPAVRIVRSAGNNLRQMQDQMNGHQQQPQTPYTPPATATRKKEGDYIDYEEVK